MWNYAGGWQELFPSVNEACVYRGERIPFHGEVASLPWEHEVVVAGGAEVKVRFWTETHATPFRVERTLGLRDGEAELVIDGTVENRSTEAAHFVWGHHCVVGLERPRDRMRVHLRRVGAGNLRLRRAAPERDEGDDEHDGHDDQRRNDGEQLLPTHLPTVARKMEVRNSGAGEDCVVCAVTG